ncbi:toxin-antitoxin system YwqK family antitoxin [Hymenobacter profundi]|uniref:Uncharacterized protein n=1 Tax=Hymenobacter profundi TaxID=1982110 RepID=A0ABS6WUF9_9BACT|nr:hypothetical protein [Hymenobacter profundi]MBW3127200.1 hypothetical protein [Hymenobacter profundi]
MAKLYFIQFLLLISVPTLAQKSKTTVPLPPTDTVYFDHDWERTDIAQDRVYARIARHGSDGLTVGTVRDYFYPSWKKQFEGKLIGEAPDVASGLCAAWYENGKPHFTGTYIKGAPQGDYREWREDGREIKVKLKWQEALALSTAKLHSYYNSGSSRVMVPVPLPPGTVGVVYKIDIRDEGQPPITWSTAITLAAAYAAAPVTGGASLLLTAGAKALASEAQQTPPEVSTKCRFFVTDDTQLTVPFMAPATKGQMPPVEHCFRSAVNVTQESRSFAVAPGTSQIFICVQNDNSRTAAKLSISVNALVKSRE